MATGGKVTQKQMRQGINVGSGLLAVSPVAYWYKHGHFDSEAEARGAFKLAYQQAMDGMGKSIHEWMGLTEAQYDAWMRDGALPDPKKIDV